jgi:hypothetical protein
VLDIRSAADLTQAVRFRLAVSAAIAAYARTGRMVDAALAYAELGVPVFPCDPRTKVPIPPRDRDPEDDSPVPGTGGHYKATCDPLRIRAWWKDHPKALIAVPMGPRSGVWCLDVDTSEDHADGLTEWNEILLQRTRTEWNEILLQHARIETKWGKHPKHNRRAAVLSYAVPPITTREHRSATGGPHLIFNWYEELPIRCGKGALPSGIEVKGQGGYIVVPPSERKGRSYTVFRDIDPAPAPSWLKDLILQGKKK